MSRDLRYRLTPSVWGAAVEVPLVNIDQDALGGYADVRGTAYVPVTLEDSDGAWAVLRDGDGTALGTIPSAERARFPEVERVHQSGLIPETLVEVRRHADIGLFGAMAFFPPSPLAVPRNGTPPGAAALPPGDMLVVDTAAGEFTGSELAGLCPAQWIVGLEVVGGRVVATLGGRALGPVEEDGGLRTLLVDAPVAPHARAFALNGLVGLDAGGPVEQAEPIAALSAPAPETWKVTEFPDGTWAVTAPLTAPPPNGRRLVRAPGRDFSPTRSWQVSAGNFLSEVEKVRLRREKEGRRGSGRHRLLL